MIRKELVLDIRYQSPYNTEKQHTILPASLYYNAHYFYVVAFNLTFESYMTLKLDRIIDWKVSKEKKPLTSNYFQVHIKVEIRAVKCYDKKRRYI